MRKGEGWKEFRWANWDRSSWCVTAVWGKCFLSQKTLKIHRELLDCNFFPCKISKKPHPSLKNLPSFPTGLKPSKREEENEKDMQRIRMFSDKNGRYFNPNNSFLLKFSLWLKSCSVLKCTQSRRERGVGLSLKLTLTVQCVFSCWCLPYFQKIKKTLQLQRNVKIRWTGYIYHYLPLLWNIKKRS